MLLFASIMQYVSAQEIGIKTNLVSDALLNANIGAEMRLSPKWSIDLSGDFNFWNLSHDRKWKHWTVMPEARYWLCDALGGHFFGAHLLGGEFNVGNLDLPFSFLGSDFRQLRDNRFQGVVCRRRYRLRIFMAPVQALEPRSRNRHRVCICPLRPV